MVLLGPMVIQLLRKVILLIDCWVFLPIRLLFCKRNIY